MKTKWSEKNMFCEEAIWHHWHWSTRVFPAVADRRAFGHQMSNKHLLSEELACNGECKDRQQSYCLQATHIMQERKISHGHKDPRHTMNKDRCRHEVRSQWLVFNNPSNVTVNVLYTWLAYSKKGPGQHPYALLLRGSVIIV